MAESTDVKIAGPLLLDGPAVERDNCVRDKNDGPRPVEAEWLARGEALDSDLSKSEVEFFVELRKRQTQ
jgi:hypothetical protein